MELWLVKSTWFLASSLYSKINILGIPSQYEIIFLWLRFRFASHCGFAMSNNWNLYNNLFNFNENDTRRCALWMCYLDTWLWFPLPLMRPHVCRFWHEVNHAHFVASFRIHLELFKFFEFTLLELLQDLYTPTCLLRRHISMGWTNHGLSHVCLLLFSNSFEIYTTPTWPFGNDMFSRRAPIWATNILFSFWLV